MESTGKAGAIQVTEETCHILQMFDYCFEQRGLVAVKGKGQLMTFYLIGKNEKLPTSPIIQNSPRKIKIIENDLNNSKNSSRDSPKSNTTASPSSVRLNENYKPDVESDNGKNFEGNKIICITNSENDPLLSQKSNVAINNHFSNDENSSLLENSKFNIEIV